MDRAEWLADRRAAVERSYTLDAPTYDADTIRNGRASSLRDAIDRHVSAGGHRPRCALRHGPLWAWCSQLVVASAQTSGGMLEQARLSIQAFGSN